MSAATEQGRLPQGWFADRPATGRREPIIEVLGFCDYGCQAQGAYRHWFGPFSFLEDRRASPKRDTLTLK
jgi:hypothetical protein